MRHYNHDVVKATYAIQAADENHLFTLKTVKHAKLERILHLGFTNCRWVYLHQAASTRACIQGGGGRRLLEVMEVC